MLFKRKSENLPRVVFKKYLFYVTCLLEECGSNRHSSSLNLSGVIKLYPIRFVSDESCGCWISLCCWTIKNLHCSDGTATAESLISWKPLIIDRNESFAAHCAADGNWKICSCECWTRVPAVNGEKKNIRFDMFLWSSRVQAIRGYNDWRNGHYIVNSCLFVWTFVVTAILDLLLNLLPVAMGDP
jgi:hypothetical protein